MKFKKTAAGLTALALSVTALATPLSENFSGILDGLFDKISYSADAETYGDYEYYVPYGVDTIEISAYTGADSEITIPGTIDGKTVTSIGSSAFRFCSNLVSVTIPESVTSIGEYAFSFCENLESVNIPNGVTSIGAFAFEKCTKLAEVTIPDSVTIIGSDAFYETAIVNNQDTDVKYVDNWAVASNQEAKSFNIKSGTRGIGNYAFLFCTNITSIDIPDSVKYIGLGAFGSCESLESVTIPGNVKSIGTSAFLECSSLESVTILDGVESIGRYAFKDCPKLTEITIPDSVKYIGASAFYNTAIIDNQTSDVKYVDNWAINCNSEVTSITINSGTIGIAEYAFGEYSNSKCTSITIPYTVTTIVESAFSDCRNIEDVYFTGSENKWNSINIGNNNDYLLEATIHFAPAHAHSYDSKTTSATCTTDGVTEYTCSICGDYYTETIKATGHKYTSEITTPATCTTDGEKKYTCSVCGDFYTEVIKTTGHSYTTKVVAPTYAAKGYTLHECSCGDSYKDNYTSKLTVSNVTGLKMTSNAPTSISMSWTKVTGATGYVVYQAINGKWERIKVTSGNTLTASSLKAGTNYKFTVKAYKTVSGTNYYSPSYTGVWMTTTPAKPSAKMTVNTPQAIRLEWGKVTGATGYVVYQQINGTWVKKTVTSNNVYVATGLKSGTNYNFAVRAYRTFNGKNYYSPFATATDTIKTCTKPATVNFTLTAGAKKATVNWSKVTGATGYIVYYKTSANGSWQKLKTTTGTSFTKTGLTSGKTYYFTVKAYKTYNGKTYNASFTTKSVKVK